jgi:hypothetical protein
LPNKGKPQDNNLKLLSRLLEEEVSITVENWYYRELVRQLRDDILLLGTKLMNTMSSQHRTIIKTVITDPYTVEVIQCACGWISPMFYHNPNMIDAVKFRNTHIQEVFTKTKIKDIL